VPYWRLTQIGVEHGTSARVLQRKGCAGADEKFGYKSVMEVPRITKITLNMGVGEAVADKKVMENAVGDLTKIAGQKPVVTKARRPSPASRSVRLSHRCMVTLRGERCTNSWIVS
jgi:large subunit ribosomal protein L5